jgi:uncharacterized membrane protein YkvA (DUF1232 family)
MKSSSTDHFKKLEKFRSSNNDRWRNVMAEKKDRRLDRVGADNESFLVGLYNNLRLIFRLVKDPRISFLTKILPIGALIYLIIPTDVLPINPIDDGLILWLGGYLFIDLCPEDIVEEHRAALQRSSGKDSSEQERSTEVVDGSYREVDEGEDQ